MRKTTDTSCQLTELERLQRDRLIFSTLLDISTDGFLIVDDRGIIIDINKAYCNFLEIRHQDALGRYVLDVITNSRLPDILASWKTEIDVVHKLAEGQSPKKDKFVAVTRAPVKQGDNVVAAVGQIKFSTETRNLAEKLQHMDGELQYYKNELKRIIGNKYSFDTMIGQSPMLTAAKTLAQKAAQNDFNILITGETGTGKEVFAHAIHFASRRRLKPFIRINCAAIPSELMESELFGYDTGSFTGAKKGGKVGKFEMANGGTVFLDEIGDMPLNMQAKLLRVLQEREVERVGGSGAIPVDVRVMAATNQNLEEKIHSRLFRSDLFYRLNVIQIKVPTLQQRLQDIPMLVDFFLQEMNERYGVRIGIAPESLDVLAKYQWPGNIRELKNVIERAFTMVEEGTITTAHLPAHIISKVKLGQVHLDGKSLDTVMGEIEKGILIDALARNNHNYRKTAKELGIHRATLYKKLEKYDMNRREF